jgi:serine/threonine protein kinase
MPFYSRRGDLGKLIRRERSLPEPLARIYAAEVLLALEDLHRRDIIFRDLKPENVVLDSEGHAMLTDFGLSKEGVQDNVSAKSFCGSIAYLAPEVLNKTGHGKSIDWYLLGLLIYEMLVGIPPYYCSNKEQLFKNIKTAPLKVPLALSEPAKTLLVGLLTRNPTKRLGAGQDDASEIKRHPWFASIDWELTLKRGLRPPKPSPKKVPTTQLSPDLFTRQTKDTKKLQGWTFIGNAEPASQP